MVNGQRFVSSNQSTVFVPGNANGSQVDLSLINPSLIQRTELVIGSSGGATYGADAVAGVVNVILKDDYDGAEVTTRFGKTEAGDGQNFRFNALAGKNFFDNRANITASLEVFQTDLVRNDNRRRLQSRQDATILNPLNQSNEDGLPSTIFISGATNPIAPAGGLLVSGGRLGGSANTQFFPNTPNDAFTAAGLGTPFQFAQTAAGQALNPLLFVGTFSPTGTFLTVPNTDPNTSAFLPRLAVPLAFSASGDLLPFNIGNISPPNPADQNTVIGGDGFPIGDFDNVQSDQERVTLNILTRFDITDNITYKGDYIYSDIESRSSQGPLTNTILGGTAGGNTAIPVFVDQNPFLSSQAVGVIDNLVAQGLSLGDINGDRALFLSRTLNDVTGPGFEGASTKFFRTSQNVEGDFFIEDHSFYWGVTGAYGRVETENFADQLLDIEFALAVDVVEQNGQAVCRQQTLGSPESIALRNPNLAFINTTVSLTPTAAQVAACQPLNLFGDGAPSQAAIDYVTTSSDSTNVSEQLYLSAQFGGDIYELPTGLAVFNTQVEYRKETNEFSPGVVFAGGLARNTTGQGSQGEAEFLEYGIEVSVPLIGDDFTLPGLQSVVLDGAYRVVDRQGQGGPFNDTSESNDEIFNVGLRWKPVDFLTIRGSRSSAIRSPSIVELFGAGVTGFSGLGRGNLNPCDEDSIDSGSEFRRANCETLATNLGLPISALDGLQAPGGAAPAAGASNPGLTNEESDSWSAGFVFAPDFVPGLELTFDYYELELTGEIGLTGLNFECFDSPTFPSEVIGGFDACNALIFAVEDPDNLGSFIVPSVNPVNGQPVSPIANPGSPAQDQQALTSTFSFFPTINQGSTKIRSYYATARYGFDAGKLGTFNFSASAYRLLQFSEFTASGNDNPRVGENGNGLDPEWSTVVTLNHRIADLSHTLQWFYTSTTVEDVETDPDTFDELAIDFTTPAFNIVNYSASYDLNETVSLQFVVNNLLDATREDAAFDAGDVLGRRYSFGFTARF